MKLINTIVLTLLLALPIIGFSAEAININTADKETLMSVIKGVGEKKADAIIAYRTENGNFKSIDELTNVKGIGQGTIDKHREQLSTSE
ncbi:MAG TPA: ComEA family DNA-binding protein [Thiotrichaceae bacterium]|jgi:competence protein ComEA|nr:ComEA family DNA-binding protein [Thiotrichaceae bacterium]HIM07527.1 ComEA family DNA-binding protein [Gammaproteobacteria bacterium]